MPPEKSLSIERGVTASALDEIRGIRERWSKVAYVGLKPEVVPEPGHQTPWLPDVDHLLKAVEAALSRHVQAAIEDVQPEPFRYCETCAGHPAWPCPEVADITAALAGKEAD